MNDKDFMRKQVSYIICSVGSLSESLYIAIDTSGKFTTTNNIDEANIFKSQSAAGKAMTGLNHKIRKQAAGWKVEEIVREFDNSKIKYQSKLESDKSINMEISEMLIVDFILLCNKADSIVEIESLLLSVYNKRQKYMDLLEMYNRQQCDILHTIENEKLDAVQRVKICGQLKSVREKRRQVKNAIHFIEKTNGTKNISVILSEIKNIQEQKYAPRAFDSV